MERIVDIGGYGVMVRAETGWLVVETGTGEKTGVPIRDIAVVVLSTPAATLSGALLSEVAEAGGVVVVCGGEKNAGRAEKRRAGPLSGGEGRKSPEGKREKKGIGNELGNEERMESMIGLLAQMAQEAAKASLGRMFVEGVVRSAGAAAGMLAVHEAARLLQENRERRMVATCRAPLRRNGYYCRDWNGEGGWR